MISLQTTPIPTCERPRPDILTTDSGPDGVQAREQLASFNIWTKVIGVFRHDRHSLMCRLKGEPNIKKLVGRLLHSLESDLSNYQSGQAEEGTSSDNDSHQSSDRSIVYSDKSLLSLEEHGEASPPHQPEIWTSIRDTIISLRQLGQNVDQAANQHFQKQIQQFKLRPDIGELFHLFKRCARQKVYHVFPNASASLRNRMAQSIATRRVRFIYLAEHQTKLSTLCKHEENPNGAEAFSPVGHRDGTFVRQGRLSIGWKGGGGVQRGQEAIVTLLVDRGADINIPDRDHQTPLLRATRMGYEDIVKLLVDQGAYIDTLDRDGRTPLSWAAQGGHDAIVRLLTDRGGNINTLDKDLQTPLIWATKTGDEACVRILIDRSAELDAISKHGESALTIAAKEGHDAIFKLLLDRAGQEIAGLTQRSAGHGRRKGGQKAGGQGISW
ncbi:hypothetical protein L249_2027 [Ophiocordyceps polyrhachis-furcata BCC 54312]|uniref:Uncharacterized protein n=1 Tax=Ophiocordyceps polyrhachis-furcata BCC 54312 TaxID=1330021 RepID=A0A367LQX5_9HYPO|nr:hypothetical protein L249_2027 [Ophiocordyceps polyrhachis-furcata BCC 54312]